MLINSIKLKNKSNSFSYHDFLEAWLIQLEKKLKFLFSFFYIFFFFLIIFFRGEIIIDNLPDDETYQDNCFKLGEIYGVIYQYLDDCQDKEPPEIPNIPKDLMESFQEASSFLSDLELVTLKKTLNL